VLHAPTGLAVTILTTRIEETPLSRLTKRLALLVRNLTKIKHLLRRLHLPICLPQFTTRNIVRGQTIHATHVLHNIALHNAGRSGASP
jgi:hypothetical protein